MATILKVNPTFDNSWHSKRLYQKAAYTVLRFVTSIQGHCLKGSTIMSCSVTGSLYMFNALPLVYQAAEQGFYSWREFNHMHASVIINVSAEYIIIQMTHGSNNQKRDSYPCQALTLTLSERHGNWKHQELFQDSFLFILVLGQKVIRKTTTACQEDLTSNWHCSDVCTHSTICCSFNLDSNCFLFHCLPHVIPLQGGDHISQKVKLLCWFGGGH